MDLVLRGTLRVISCALVVIGGSGCESRLDSAARLASSPALHAEALAVLAEMDESWSGSMPAESWPKSIAALRPRAVHVQNGVMKIVLSSGGIDSATGILISRKELPERYREWLRIVPVSNCGGTTVVAYETIE